jgi:hypothetical protein
VGAGQVSGFGLSKKLTLEASIGMKTAPERCSGGRFCLVAGAGFEPATSGL